MTNTQPHLRFTLIELLVVIAIISILASLLLPALDRAKSQARSIACINNQKQVGMVLFTYADDFKGRYPGYWMATGGEIRLYPYFLAGNQSAMPGWSDDGAAYLEQGSGVMGCPSNEAYTTVKSVHGNSNYGYGSFVFDNGDKNTMDEDFSRVVYMTSGNRPQLYEIRPSKVKQPSDILMTADVATTRNWNGNPADHRNLARLYRDAQGGWTERVHIQHLGKANGMFMDGHAEGQTVEEMYGGVMNITRFYTEEFEDIDL